MSAPRTTLLESGRLWPWFIAALLVATAAGQGVMLYAATHDPTFAIEPDYYAKAVAWDTTMLRERENARLGWRADGSMQAGAAGASVRVEVTDGGGAPISGAQVHVTAIHNLDSRHPTTIALTGSAGVYAGELPGAHRGLWELRVDAVRGSSHFTPSLRVDFTP